MFHYLTFILLLLFSLPSFAVIPLDNGHLTEMESDSDKIISYKHQEHMWVTADGALHMMIKYNIGMSLYSSFDQGKTWQEMLATQGIEQPASSDGVWVCDYLYTVYSTQQGNIGVAKLHYDKENKTWSAISQQTVETGPDVTATRPTITADSSGRLWVAFPANHILIQRKYIRVYYSQDEGTSWQDSGMRLGTENAKDKAARILALSDRIGIIYSDNDRKDAIGRWAYRMNDWPFEQAWQDQEIGRHPYKYFQDPLGTHYNVVVDNTNNIHVTSSDAGELVYFRYDSHTQAWESPTVVDQIQKTAYTQLSITPDNRIFLIHNSGVNVIILMSQNQGKTFEPYAQLTPPALKNISFLFPRVETPSISDGKTLHVLLQAQEKGIFGQKVLLHYAVPTE